MTIYILIKLKKLWINLYESFELKPKITNYIFFCMNINYRYILHTFLKKLINFYKKKNNQIFHPKNCWKLYLISTTNELHDYNLLWLILL